MAVYNNVCYDDATSAPRAVNAELSYNLHFMRKAATDIEGDYGNRDMSSRRNSDCVDVAIDRYIAHVLLPLLI